MNLIVALMVYRRTYHLRCVLEALKKGAHQIDTFYVFCDGARSAEEVGAVDGVRKIIRQSDWIPRIVIEHPNHLGLAQSVVFAVDYVLERHPTLILLEDDCVVGPHFFNFMERCLELYGGNKDILSISGYTVPIPEDIRALHPWDVYFFPRFGSWGWATWRDRWELYERDFKVAYNRVQGQGLDLERGGSDIGAIIQRAIQNDLDVWTPGFLLGGILNNTQTIYPTVSHIQNIGHDGSGVHCGKTALYETPMEFDRPTRFPPDIIKNWLIDHHFRKYYDR